MSIYRFLATLLPLLSPIYCSAQVAQDEGYRVIIDTLNVRDFHAKTKRPRDARWIYRNDKNVLEIELASSRSKQNSPWIIFECKDMDSARVYKLNDSVFYVKAYRTNSTTYFLRFNIQRQPWGCPWNVITHQTTKRAYVPSTDQFVDILEVSHDYVSPSVDSPMCEKYKVVKVAVNGQSLWVNGQSVYGIIESNLSLLTVIGGKTIEVKSTSNYGMPDSDDEQITGCGSYNYAVIIVDGTEHLIRLDHVPDGRFPYLQLPLSYFHKACAKELRLSSEGYTLYVCSAIMEGFADSYYSIRQDKHGEFVANPIYAVKYYY